jgi:hypothetical protein
MKKTLIVFLGFLLVFATLALAQDKQSTLIVKETSVATGVVIVDGQWDGKAVSLQCNHGYADCSPLKPGTYIGVMLPKNWGMYQCQNVDVYAPNADPEKDQKLGEYCLNPK